MSRSAHAARLAAGLLWMVLTAACGATSAVPHRGGSGRTPTNPRRALFAETVSGLYVVNAEGVLYFVDTIESFGQRRAIPFTSPVVEVAATQTEVCARTSRRDVFCWGDIASHADPERSCEWHSGENQSPTLVVADAVWVGQYAGRFCAVLASNDLVCWGWSDSVAPSRLSAPEYVCSPTRVALGGAVCRAHTGGGVLCCGSDRDVVCESAGDPGWAPRGVEVRVAGLTGTGEATALWVRDTHVCSSSGGGVLRCCDVGEDVCVELDPPAEPLGISVGGDRSPVLMTQRGAIELPWEPMPHWWHMPWIEEPLESSIGSTDSCRVYVGEIRARCRFHNGLTQLVVDQDACVTVHSLPPVLAGRQ